MLFFLVNYLKKYVLNTLTNVASERHEATIHSMDYGFEVVSLTRVL